MTFEYQISLNDSEVIMLDKALRMLIEHCDKELNASTTQGESPKAPFWSHKHSAENVLQQLHLNMKQTSSNVFKPVTILVAHQQKLYREAQKLAINKILHFKVIGEAVDFNDLLERLQYCKPDILIVNDCMQKDNLLNYISQIKKLHPRLKLIATSYYEEDIEHLKKLKGQVDGLLVGAIEENQFIKGIELVCSNVLCYWHQGMWHK